MLDLRCYPKSCISTAAAAEAPAAEATAGLLDDNLKCAMCLSLCERPVTVRLHTCMHTATWYMHRHAGRHSADELAAAAMLHACVCLRFIQPAPPVGPLQLSSLRQSWFQISCFMTCSAAVGTQGLPARTKSRLPFVIILHKGRDTFNHSFANQLRL